VSAACRAVARCRGAGAHSQQTRHKPSPTPGHPPLHRRLAPTLPYCATSARAEKPIATATSPHRPRRRRRAAAPRPPARANELDELAATLGVPSIPGDSPRTKSYVAVEANTVGDWCLVSAIEMRLARTPVSRTTSPRPENTRPYTHRFPVHGAPLREHRSLSQGWTPTAPDIGSQPAGNCSQSRLRQMKALARTLARSARLSPLVGPGWNDPSPLTRGPALRPALASVPFSSLSS